MTRKGDVRLRPEQEAIVSGYTHGLIGIAAVPGSGKTFTLAHLAARLIADRRVQGEQEVLIVTFTNSAVDSFRARVSTILRDEYGLLPSVGYRVRTLHGLAHDIVRERPALVGLSDDFTILDEQRALEIQREIVTVLATEWRSELAGYLDPAVETRQAWRALEGDLPALVASFIKHAKNHQMTPSQVSALLPDAPEFALSRFAAEVYAEYQRSLAYRGAVDFDDLVRLALVALEMDGAFLQRLQQRWPYILEDEAQDSSRLQEHMLLLLSAERNWVRVGDPNQAINTTFTTADPRFLLDFLAREDVTEFPLSVSGRSAEPIIDLANTLVRWTVEDHVAPQLRGAFAYQLQPAKSRNPHPLRGVIRPAAADDPQPNPPDDACTVLLHHRPDQKITPDRELALITSEAEYSLLLWLEEILALPEEQRPTVAVLVPENSRGFKLAELLRNCGIEYEELLRSTTHTRDTITFLGTVLDYLSVPADLRKLKEVFWALLPAEQRQLVKGDVDLRQSLSRFFGAWDNLEDFLWPAPGQMHNAPTLPSDHGWLAESLQRFRERVRRWLVATTLPVDQLVLTVAHDCLSEPAEIALAHKVAVVLRGVAESHPEWRLPQFVEELRMIGGNQRRFLGFDTASNGYTPRPGVVTVATMHAAKGLEWDRVYLMAVSNYAFPSLQANDTYYGEKWYARGAFSGTVAHLNLEAELLAQLESVSGGDAYSEGEASLRARVAYAEERLRLLYVAITRARRDLIVTWNMGRYWHRGRGYENQPALPLVMLGEYLR